ncbi:hypothetical protein D3C74_343900 [compost metagenome]
MVQLSKLSGIIRFSLLTPIRILLQIDVIELQRVGAVEYFFAKRMRRLVHVHRPDQKHILRDAKTAIFLLILRRIQQGRRDKVLRLNHPLPPLLCL